MSNQNEQILSPFDSLVVRRTNLSNALNDELLFDLYIKIIGSNAYALYKYFWRLGEIRPLISSRTEHQKLLTTLDMDLKSFITARNKLEAIGLMKTFFDEDQLGKYYLYEMYLPLDSDRFLNDSLLSSLLKETVGSNEFNALVDKYNFAGFDVSKYKNVTHNVFQIFAIDPAKVSNININVKQNNRPSIGQTNFDWDLVEQQLIRSGISLELIPANSVSELNKFYNLSEIELATAINQAIGLNIDKELDLTKLEQLINQNISEKTSGNIDQLVEEKISSADLAKLTPRNQNLLQIAIKLEPLNFLKEIKQRRHGYVGQGEIRIVKALTNRYVLPNSVINIMIDYILQTNASLSQGLVDAIANDWLAKNIVKPTDALLYISEFTSKKRKPKTNSHKEAKTDWNSKRSQTTYSEDEIKSMQEKAKKLIEDNIK